MRNRLKYNTLLTVATLTALLLLGACVDKVKENDIETEAMVAFSIRTYSANDPIAVNNDDSFQSLALFIYHENENTPQRAILIPVFTPSLVKEWSQTIQVKSGNKTVYAIANYTGTTLKNSSGTTLTLSPTTSKTELEDIMAYSLSGFTSSNLLMVAKNTFNIGTTEYNKSVPMNLRRLQARVDLHVYKGTSLSAQTVKLKSVRLTNLMQSSEVKYSYDPQTATMPTPISPINYNYTAPANTLLTAYPGVTTLTPSMAHANLYSYQNIVTITDPLPSNVPILEIVVEYGSVNYTYTSKLTDNAQSQYKYSLLQNRVYVVSAIIQAAGNITLNVSSQPWTVQSVNTQRPITSADCTLKSWANSWSGINAKAIHTLGEAYTDATFSFELKAPEGAAWTATLTNGLDFQFVSTTSGISTPAVTRGFARPGTPYLIAVRATKPWDGTVRQAELFITVNGVEIPINPISGGVRPYAGSSDTRVLIKQVYSTDY